MINKLLTVFSILIFSLHSFAEIGSRLQLSSLNFISQDFESTEEKSYGFLGLQLKSFKAEDDQFKLNVDSKYAPTNSVLSYVNIREIYFTNFSDADTQVHFGRRMLAWSQADAKWNLGLFQPQFRWNPLDLENQGLTGIFYDKNLNNEWSLNLFVTPIFIPDQGPNYEIKDGQFSASNPYFTPPPQNILFQNILLPIDYNIIKPETTDVVNQAGGGIKLNYENDLGWKYSLSGSVKPSNQFAFGYKGILVTNRVRIDILPKTYYEKLAALDVEKKWQGGRAGLSVIYNEPTNPSYDQSFNAPVFEPNTTVAPYIRFEFEAIDFEVAGLANEGGEVTELGPDANNSRQPLTNKFLYRRAYQLSAIYRHLVTENLKFVSSIQWVEAEKNLLKTLKWRNIFDIKGPWKLTLDAFLVETGEEVSPVSSYRNLDQVWAGASYDF